MPESRSVEAVLSARDKNFTSTMRRADSTVKSLGSRIKSGVGFGAFMAIGNKAVSSVANGFRSMLSDMDKTNSAWTTFGANMKAAGHSSKEIAKAKSAMQDFASKSIYYSSEMASTYAQLDAVGIKGTTNLVKGFGAVASASENPSQAMKSMSQQATQMAAKPTVAWQDFKIMMEQTPAGIAQVAKEMGMSTKELVKNVQDGSVKTETFFEAIGKIGGNANHQLMKSATQYKTIGEAVNGTSGFLMTKLAPAYSVVSKAAISGLGKIQSYIGKIDSKALADKVKAGLGKAKEVFNEMKPALKSFATMMTMSGKAVLKILPYFAKLSPALISAMTAFRGFKKVSGMAGMFKGITSGVKVFNKESGDMISIMQKAQLGSSGTVGAFTKFKTAITSMINPVGLAVLGVGALAGGLVYLASRMNSDTSLTTRLSQSYRNTAAAAQEAANSYETIKKSAEDNAASQLTQLDSTQSVIDQMNQLVDGNGKVKKGYEQRFSNLAAQVKEATGIEIKAQDGVIQKYDELMGKVDQYIEKKRAQIEFEANEEIYAAAKKGYQKEIEAATDAEAKIAEIEKKRVGKGKYLTKEDQAELTKRQEAQKKHLEKAAEYGAKMQQIDEANAAYADGNFKKYNQIMSQNFEERTKIEGHGHKQLIADEKEYQAKSLAAAQLYSQEANDATLQNVNKNVALWNVAKAKLLDNGAYANVAEAVTQLGIQTGQALPKGLQEGIESGQYMLPTTVQEMTNLIDFQNLANKAGKGGQDAVNQLKAQMATGQISVGEAVTQLSASAGNKFRGMSNKAKPEAQKAANALPSEVKKAAPKVSSVFAATTSQVMKSATGLTKNVGNASKKTGDSVEKNMKPGLQKVSKAADKPMSSFIKSLSGTKAKAESNGRYMIGGLATGMASMLGRVQSIAAKIAAAADKAIRKKAQIASPSKVQKKNGAYIALGLVKGMKKMEGKVTAASKSLIGKINNTMKSASKSHNYNDKASSALNLYNTGLDKTAKTSITKYNKAVDKAMKAARKKTGKNAKKQRKAITAYGKTVKQAYSKQINSQIKAAKASAKKETEALAKKYQAKYDAIIQARSTFIDRLRDYGSLVNTDSYGFSKLTDFGALSKQIDRIQKGLKKLQKLGVSQNFLNQITSLDKNEQEKVILQLSKLGDAGIKAYAQSFDSYWSKANTVGNNIYKPYIDALDSAYNKDLKKVMDKLKAEMNKIGKQTSKGLVKGLNDKATKKQLNKVSASLAKTMVSTIKKALKIKSPSRVMEGLGKYTSQGLAQGIDKDRKYVVASLEKLTALPEMAVNDFASSINGTLSSEFDYSSHSQVTVVVPVNMDGKKVAEVIADPVQQQIDKNQMRANRMRGIR